mgnify:CR=1 FL=1|tara:strand:- start:276 stop:587 length:312 start_codon:yes stop_codon:yes gene_type:complete
MNTITPWLIAPPKEKIVYRIKEDCFLLYNEDNVLVLLRSIPPNYDYQYILDAEAEKTLEPETAAIVVRNPVTDCLVLCVFSNHLTVTIEGQIQLQNHPVVLVR